MDVIVIFLLFLRGCIVMGMGYVRRESRWKTGLFPLPSFQELGLGGLFFQLNLFKEEVSSLLLVIVRWEKYVHV